MAGENGKKDVYYVDSGTSGYDAEDANCKSENITATLDELTVNLEFKLTTLGAAATDSGVEVPTT